MKILCIVLSLVFLSACTPTNPFSVTSFLRRSNSPAKIAFRPVVMAAVDKKKALF